MNELNYPETTKWVVFHNEDKYSCCAVEPQNCFATGMPFMEIFNSEEEAKTAYPQAFPEPETLETDISNTDPTINPPQNNLNI